MTVISPFAVTAVEAQTSCKRVLLGRKATEIDFESVYNKTAPFFRSEKLKLISQEAFPVEVYESMQRKGSNNKKGIYRAMTRQVFEAENFLVEIVDSAITEGRPPTFDSQLRNLNFKQFEFAKTLPTSYIPDIKEALAQGEDPAYYYDRWGIAFPQAMAKEAEQNAVRDGQRRQKEVLDEILGFVFPLYQERRQWTPEFINHLTKKAYETANSTRYIVIRNKSSHSSRPNQIIATIGLTRVTYGKVRFFNKATLKWEERLGSFGNSYNIDNYSEAYPNFGFSQVQKWVKPLELLPIEKIFGETAFLPRPASHDELDKNLVDYYKGDLKQIQEIILSALKNSQFPPGIEPDFEQSIEFSSGQIFEPTKFAIAKDDELKSSAKVEILQQAFASIFSKPESAQSDSMRQYLYTYNDQEGIILYRRMGFKLLESITPKVVDGVKWYAIGLSPRDLAEHILNTYSLTEADATEILNYMQEIGD